LSPHFFTSTSSRLHSSFLPVVVSVDGCPLRGSALGGISCASSVDWETHYIVFPIPASVARVLGVAPR